MTVSHLHIVLIDDCKADHVSANGFSHLEAVREKSIKVLNNQEIEGMKKVCRVSISFLFICHVLLPWTWSC